MLETLDAEAFREWGGRFSNWGRWGWEDRRGTLNFIRREQVLAACAIPRHGRVIDCDRPDAAHQRQAAPAGPARWDPPGSLAYDGKSYNGRGAGDVESADADGGPGVLARGVLLDLPRFIRHAALEVGTRILPRDLDECAEAQGVAVQPGDVLLVRTGAGVRGAGRSAAGLSVHCASWLYEREIACVAADSPDLEVHPAEIPGIDRPLHRIALRDMGLPLGGAFALEALAEACAGDGTFEFLFVAAPPGFGPASVPAHPFAVK